MRLESVWFGDDPCYESMANVLKQTSETHCPNWQINIKQITTDDLESHQKANISHVANTQKMVSWAKIIREAEDGEQILLIDADTFFLASIDDVWSRNFDLAYTTKDSKFPFNSGVMFVRVNEKTKHFFDLWEAENLRMLKEEAHHMPWRLKYGGINQASLGNMLEHGIASTLSLIKLPCREWNHEDSAWGTDLKGVRIVHVKGKLRECIFGRPRRRWPKGVENLTKIWQTLEESCTSQTETI